VMVSLLQGFGLGIGYALQPYIVSLLSGCNYYFSGMIEAGDIIWRKKSYICYKYYLLFL
jgi:small-conductance mechanosensitive channel